MNLPSTPCHYRHTRKIVVLPPIHPKTHLLPMIRAIALLTTRRDRLHPVRGFMFLPAPPHHFVERGLGSEVSLIQKRVGANVLFRCYQLFNQRHPHAPSPSRSVILRN